MAAPLVMLCGSRSLPGASAPLVGRVVSALLGAGAALSVGCAVGADAAAISAVLAAGAAPRLGVWCAFGPVSPPWPAARYRAPGACSASAVSAVGSALLAGASVRWWAGGPVTVPLRARLARRSLACVRAASAGGPGSGLVAFVAGLPSRPFAAGAWPSCGSGSWASVAAAALRGLAVVVVPVGGLAGVSVASLPALPGGGAWVPVSAGVVSVGFRWVR